MKRAPRILFAGGGTGGHVYPAIAIADALRRLAPEAEIAFAGTRERMEWEAVPRAGYPIHPITASGFHRGQPMRNVSFPFKLARGLAESWRLVGTFRPDVVVGTGGFVSGPVLFAAGLRGKPLVVQEQNAHAGVTNRMLARRAARIHVAFEEAKAAFPPGKSVLSGNPTRQELLQATREAGRGFYDIPGGAPVLFVFGGSLGSAALNDALERHLAALLSGSTAYVVWQTGARYYERLQARIPSHPRLRLLKYVDRMDLTYAAADLALCRSGAITCSELMVTGTPSILVPSPNVAEDHQTKNAQSMVAAGAAALLPEARLDERLVPEALALLGDATRRAAMRQAALRIARPDAADRIARDVLSLVEA